MSRPRRHAALVSWLISGLLVSSLWIVLILLPPDEPSLSSAPVPRLYEEPRAPLALHHGGHSFVLGTGKSLVLPPGVVCQDTGDQIVCTIDTEALSAPQREGKQP